MNKLKSLDAQDFKIVINQKFNALKAIAHSDQLQKSVLVFEQGYLLPVCQLHLSDEELIQKLSDWRDENNFAYPTQFKVTFEGTKNWLKDKLLDIDGRILFLVYDQNNTLIGHMGFNNCSNDQAYMEIDNVVRGVNQQAPGLMTDGMKALLDWAQRELHPELIYLRVFKDNEHAVKFYKRLDFVEFEEIPLCKKVKGEMTSYVPIEDGHQETDKVFLKMILKDQS